MNLLHTLESAPAKSKETLAAVQQANGFAPNIFKILANSPSTLNGFVAFVSSNDAGTLSPAERQIVQLTASIENNGEYCVAGHSVFADNIGLSTNVVAAIRNRRKIDDPRYQALVEITQSMVRSRGKISDTEVKTFLEAGFTSEQVLEVIVGIALKTVTNFVGSTFDLPLDQQFEHRSWTNPLPELIVAV